MKVYFAGSELDSLTVGTGIISNILAATDYADTANGIRGTMFPRGTDTSIRGYLLDDATQARTAVNQGSVWVHYRYRHPRFNTRYDGAAIGRTMALVDEFDRTIIQLYLSTSGSLILRYLDDANGSIWVDVGVAQTFNANDGLRQIDIELKIGADGAIRWYIDKVMAAEVTGLDTSGMSVSCIEMWSPSSQTDTNAAGYTSIVVADSQTLDVTLRRRGPTANGAYGAWLNDFAAIDEYALDTADFVTGSVVGDKETFTAAVAAPVAGREIKAVLVAANARNDAGTAPQHVRGTLRIGGADYDAAGDMDGISTGWGGLFNIFPVDPSTGSAWADTPGNVNSEFGLKATT